MSHQSEIEKLEAELKSLDEAQDEIWHTYYDKEVELKDHKRAIIKEQGWLKHRVWRFIPHEHGTSPSFYLDGGFVGCHGEKDENIKKLFILLNLDYHDQFDLVRGKPNTGGVGRVSFRTDDGDIRLLFHDDETAIQFIEEYALTISFEDLEKHITDLEGRLASAREVLEQARAMCA